ncbi:hypothetical protein COLO4_05774 [Corchorus olitorius]|uniref:Uncharacterized protein n=1 Tax=Corchorus olitorius TaxID=93759 RepID=A0A1R3KQ26_9ROSI|nr:hypothetical protein COLO4_05774 [Corchorus olitorius]
MDQMNGLQRSTTSFRRQGSSGLVWDDKFLSGDLNQMKALHNDQENMMKRSRSEGGRGGGGGGRMYRAAREASPSVDPPSPKVSGCGLCGIFGNPDAGKKRRSSKRKL